MLTDMTGTTRGSGLNKVVFEIDPLKNKHLNIGGTELPIAFTSIGMVAAVLFSADVALVT